MTDIGFNTISANLRVPGSYFEFDASHANSALPNLRALLIGSMIAAGAAAPNVPASNKGEEDGKVQFGQGSILAGMVSAYRKTDPTGEMWTLPLADAGGATAASGNISFTGPATAAGTLSLYLAGHLVAVPVTSGMTATALVTAIVAAVTADADCAVTAAVDGTHAYQVDFTAKNAGLTGNDIDIRLNYLGSRAGEITPPGIVATITAMSGGATNPTLTTALANLQDLPFEVIACAYTDAASLAALTAFLSDTAGRWSYTNEIYGHYLIAYRGTFSGLTTFGQTLNDQHSSALGINDSPRPMWRVAASLAAATMVSVRADPAQPIREVVLDDVLAPPVASRFSFGQRDTLLHDGISTFKVNDAGQVILEKLISTYQKNSFNSPDNSYLDAETLFTLAAVVRAYKALHDSQFARCKLAEDGSFLVPGSAVVTPKLIRNAFIALYRELEQENGWVQQSDVFAANLIVQKNSSNPDRVDVLLPLILINRLDILAQKVQFRLS